jgi:hypothetical protein
LQHRYQQRYTRRTYISFLLIYNKLPTKSMVLHKKLPYARYSINFPHCMASVSSKPSSKISQLPCVLGQMNCIQKFPAILFNTYVWIILPTVPYIPSYILLLEFPTINLNAFVILLVCAPCTAIYSFSFDQAKNTHSGVQFTDFPTQTSPATAYSPSPVFFSAPCSKYLQSLFLG